MEEAKIAVLNAGDAAPDVAPRPRRADHPLFGLRWLSPPALALAVTGVGIVLRLWALSHTALVAINGDEAATGLMVRQILAGEKHFVFYAGQQYNGSLEQYLQAGMYWALHLPQNRFTLRLPQVALMAIATYLMYVVGRRLLHRPWAAVVAAALFAVGPYWTFKQGIGTFGSYSDLIVVGLAAIYCALRLPEGGRRASAWAAGFGFCVGLVGWLGLSGVELLVPAGLLAAPYFLRSARLWLTAVPAVLLGALPLVAFSLRNGTDALRNAGPAVLPSTFGGRFRGLFGPVLREFVGVAYGNGAPGWPLRWQYLAVTALAVAYAWAVLRRRRGILATLTMRVEHREPLDALLVSVPIIALLYCSSKWAWYTAEPRYLFAYSPVLLWCLAAALPERPSRLRAVAVVAGVAVFAATSITMLANRPYNPAKDQTNDLAATATFLVRNGDLHGYADYWTAMPLLYAAAADPATRQLNVAPLTAGRGRFAAMTAAVDGSSETFYVSANPASTARTGGRWMEKQLRAHRVSFRAVRVGSVVVFDRLSPALKPWQLGMGLPPVKRQS